MADMTKYDAAVHADQVLWFALIAQFGEAGANRARLTPLRFNTKTHAAWVAKVAADLNWKIELFKSRGGLNHVV